MKLDRKDMIGLGIAGVGVLAAIWYYYQSQLSAANAANAQAQAANQNPYGFYGYPYFESASVPSSTETTGANGGIQPLDISGLTSGLDSALSGLSSSDNQLLSLLSNPPASTPATSSVPAPSTAPTQAEIVGPSVTVGPATDEFLFGTPGASGTLFTLPWQASGGPGAAAITAAATQGIGALQALPGYHYVGQGTQP